MRPGNKVTFLVDGKPFQGTVIAVMPDGSCHAKQTDVDRWVTLKKDERGIDWCTGWAGSTELQSLLAAFWLTRD